MHADIEIQSAAKLPTRHFRFSRVTGARSSLYRWLYSRSGNTAGSTSGAIGLAEPLIRANMLPYFGNTGNQVIRRFRRLVTINRPAKRDGLHMCLLGRIQMPKICRPLFD